MPLFSGIPSMMVGAVRVLTQLKKLCAWFGQTRVGRRLEQFKQWLMAKIVKFFLKMSAKLRWVLLALVVTRAAAVFIYKPIEGWRWQEAYWWGEVASLTVGYGDLAPKTDLGRFIAGPFHYFWIYYCGLMIGAHILVFLLRTIDKYTHFEQEWQFYLLTVIFNWVRWCVIALEKIARHIGITVEELPRPPHRCAEDDQLVTVPPQPADTDDGNLHIEEEVVA